jgi:hypothetical protein
MVRKSVIQPSFARSGGDCHAAPVSQRYRQDSWLRGHDLRTAESRGGVMNDTCRAQSTQRER